MNINEISNNYWPVEFLEIIAIFFTWVLKYFGYLMNEKDFNQHLYCKNCHQRNTYDSIGIISVIVGERLCKICKVNLLEKDFDNWTSNNETIDYFIQNQQKIAIGSKWKFQWIPFEDLTDVNSEPIGEGGFSKVYISNWKFAKNTKRWWIKKLDNFVDLKCKVAIKSLKDSQNITYDFLQEVGKIRIVHDKVITDKIVQCFGISQDPIDNNYLMIMMYIEKGNLIKYLVENDYLRVGENSWKNNISSFLNKLKLLIEISKGLDLIHEKNLIHCDFHPGNILVENKYNCYISDLGLCRPVNEKNSNKIYGVLPYVAPEVLMGNGYTKESDVYSFGIVAYEVLMELSAYSDNYYEDDNNLIIDVSLNHKRPTFRDGEIPLLIRNLIEKCWDYDASIRPSSWIIKECLINWQEDIQKDSLFSRQTKESIISNYNNYYIEKE
ncbi:MAG: Serine/threonine-protein kinase PknD [Mycoplasmataceae bacterium]|nr:Serine/threonine-protein kinase PknD [Mycoplasmataceae bacterium]WNE41385.1 MAG: Serine/threonine-protein kinase PknD [Mycoplasmataceae bacterium]